MRTFLLIASIVAAAVSPERRAAIIQTGSFHGDEVPADTPGQWFALVSEGMSASLRPVKVTVAREYDAILDDEHERTGKRVEVSPPLEAIVLVKGVASLRAGAVPTSFVRQPILPDVPAIARLAERSYRFDLRCSAVASISSQRHEKCELTLSAGSVSQPLFTYSAYLEGNRRYWPSESPPTILWAGDLDADGRLDVLLDASDHYNVSETRLYLSSATKGRKLVLHTTRFTWAGC